MPRTVGVLPSGSTLRVKKTFINKALTEDTAKAIGMSQHYHYVRKAFDDILRALDAQFGRPLMMTHTHNTNKEVCMMVSWSRSEAESSLPSIAFSFPIIALLQNSY